MLKQMQKATGLNLGGSHLDRILALNAQLVKLRERAAASQQQPEVSATPAPGSPRTSPPVQQATGPTAAERKKIDAAIRKQIGDPANLPAPMRAQLEREIAEKMGFGGSGQAARAPTASRMGRVAERIRGSRTGRGLGRDVQGGTRRDAILDRLLPRVRVIEGVGPVRVSRARERQRAASVARGVASGAVRTGLGGAATTATGGTAAAVAARAGIAGAGAAATGGTVAGGAGAAAAAGGTAAAGVGAAAALGPVAIAAGVAAVSLGALVLATKKVSDAFSGVADGIEDVSPDVAGARAVNERRSEMSRIDRAQELGPQLAQLEASRGRFNDAMYGLGTDILEQLLKFAPVFEGGLDGITVLIEAVRATKEAAEAALATLDVTGRMDDKKEFQDLADAAVRLQDAAKEFFKNGGDELLQGRDPDLMRLLDLDVAGNAQPRGVGVGGDPFIIPNQDL